jgi:Acyltransferase family
MFLRYVHGFRAVAIVVIVAGHAVFTLTWPATSPTRDILLDVLDGGTVLFVFVAGFLFHHLAGRFAYRDYLTKKLQYVIVPYVLVSIPAIVVTLRFTDLPARFPELAGTPAAYQAVWLLAKGGATLNYPLWFVPMIALFYLAAPLFMLFVRRPRLYAVLLVLVPYSLLAHRTDELNTPVIALYFLPAYLIGMWASEYRDRLEVVLDRVAGRGRRDVPAARPPRQLLRARPVLPGARAGRLDVRAEAAAVLRAAGPDTPHRRAGRRPAPGPRRRQLHHLLRARVRAGGLPGRLAGAHRLAAAR